jgi:hypothetical protein
MLAYYAPNAAPLSERLGLVKIGKVLQTQYGVVAGPMPEHLAGLLAQLEQSEPSRLSGRWEKWLVLWEKCLRPFDRLDDVIRRSVIAAFKSDAGGVGMHR